MIIVQLAGGMGNQMFQYAIGKQLATLRNDIFKLDLSYLLDRSPRENFVFRDYDLGIFNLEALFADQKEVAAFSPKQDNKLLAIANKLKQSLQPRHLIQEKHFHFDTSFFASLPQGDLLLKGYWQSEKYFDRVAEVLRREFTLKNLPTGPTAALLDEIKQVNSVCINVRRTDFVNNPKGAAVHGAMGTDYYDQAVQLIAAQVADPRFYIFSDDVEWCRENIRLNYPSQVVGHEHKGPAFSFYLELMRQCKHFIIPNSTFAWWAAWLNAQPGKMVVAPLRWFNDPAMNTSDIIPPNWIRI